MGRYNTLCYPLISRYALISYSHHRRWKQGGQGGHGPPTFLTVKLHKMQASVVVFTNYESHMQSENATGAGGMFPDPPMGQPLATLSTIAIWPSFFNYHSSAYAHTIC